MQPFSFILDNFLRGKETYAPMRRVLNIIFSLSIASFLFETFYFRYEWMDLTDYKGFLHFFVDGDFIIPFILFLVAHYVTYFMGSLIFTLTTNKTSTKWISNIVKIKIKKRDLDNLTKRVYKNRALKLPFKVEQSWLVHTYLHLKQSIHARQWKRAEILLKRQTQIIEKNFLLLFKAILTVTIYFFTVPHFGGLLYGITIAGLIAGLAVLWYSYLVLYVLPIIMRKIDHELQQYLAEQAIQNEETVS